jgi:16S rRNA processing protein RimM
LKKFLHEEDFIEVGYVRKPYGYKGHVKLGVEPEFEEDLKESKFIFIDLKGLKVPFQIIELNDTPELTTLFAHFTSSEDASPIVGQKIFLMEKDLHYAKDFVESSKENDQWIGFNIIDSSNHKSFEILQIEEFPQQLMAVVKKNDMEVYIPLNNEFISEIDDENETILMDLPEGLLDL